MKRFISWILLLLTAFVPACALADEVVTYTADFYVADYADVLDDEVEGLIVLNNDLLDKACGAQIVVVTVDTVGSQTIENYAYTLFNEWGIGAEGKNNGLLILLAIDDGQYWIMPGKGLQDYLTAGDLDELANEHLVPPALEGNYGEGVRQLFAACFEKVAIAYSAGLTLDDSLYYDWLQLGSSGADGAKYLDGAVRELAVTPEPAVEATAEPVVEATKAPAPKQGGFSFIHVILILVVLLVVFGGVGVLRSRPRRTWAAPPPPRPVPPRPPVNPRPPMGARPPVNPRPPVSPRPPVGGYSRPTPPPMGGYNRPAQRPPMNSSRPTGVTRPSGATRPTNVSRPSGGVTRGGGAGGSFSAPRGGRSGGGFGGGRKGGGGMTRGGGSGGSFGGRR